MFKTPPAALTVAAAALLGAWPLADTLAQDLEPRLYTNVPLGMNFVGAGYGFSEGNVLFDPSIALENAEIEIDGPVLGYGRSVRLGPFSGKVDGAIARVCLDGSADYQGERVTRNVCGWTDARARVTVNFIGAPPLARQEFASYRQDWVFGASLQLGVPIGDYDPARLVNIGANRGSSKLEVGVSKNLERWLLEVSLAETFYEDNTNFFGGGIREQESITSLQGHAVYRFTSGIWLAIDATRYQGGQTTTNGARSNDLQSNDRLGLTASLPINNKQSVKLAASTGVSTRTGTDFDTVVAVWQYAWGGR
ncbi:MAG TPA: transporter [Gammaproteobacteria bacterium]|nr:transporter [Gammaproteobacteria bacterium]